MILTLVLTFMACNTTPTESSLPAVSEPQLYIGPGEQMYKMEIEAGTEGITPDFVATLRPVGIAQEAWPDITFTLEKDTLTIAESQFAPAKPVNPEGSNKFLYQKMRKLLIRDNTDIVVPQQFQKFFLVNREGVVKEIIEKTQDIAFHKKVAIIANRMDAGAPLAVYKQTQANAKNNEVTILRGFIPSKGFLLMKIQDMKDVRRIDVGNETYKISSFGITALQESVDKMYNVPITYKKFLQSNSPGKVFKANDHGGSISISRFGGVNKIYIPPNEILIYFGRSGEEATPDENVGNYTEIVIF